MDLFKILSHLLLCVLNRFWDRGIRNSTHSITILAYNIYLFLNIQIERALVFWCCLILALTLAHTLNLPEIRTLPFVYIIRSEREKKNNNNWMQTLIHWVIYVFGFSAKPSKICLRIISFTLCWRFCRFWFHFVSFVFCVLCYYYCCCWCCCHLFSLILWR